MTTEEFRDTLQQDAPPQHFNSYQKALWYDARGDWEQAHEYAQQQNDSQSAWVHAYLHRKEGDTFNAQYWYTRAGKKMPDMTLTQEADEMIKVLLAT